MVTVRLTKENAALTDDEKKVIEKARKLPVVYDDDSPELTDEMEKAFLAARKARIRNVL